MKIIILGHARHGKDTFAGMLSRYLGLKFKSSSESAAEIFLYEALKDKYNYKSFIECFNDRANHRAEWHDLICEYNKEDPAKLAKKIFETNDIYVGMRSNIELDKCKQDGLVDYIIGVYNPGIVLEPASSFNIDIWKQCDFIIPNSGTLAEFDEKAQKLSVLLTARKWLDNGRFE